MEILKKDLTVSVCPHCASAKLESFVNEFRCTNCGQTFPFSDALVHTPKKSGICDVPGRPITAHELVLEMAKDLMNCLYRTAALPIGMAIREAAFCGEKDTEALTRLIRAGCQGAYRAIILEMENIATERQVPRGNPS